MGDTIFYREYETVGSEYSKQLEHRISITTTDLELHNKLKDCAEKIIQEHVEREAKDAGGEETRWTI